MTEMQGGAVLSLHGGRQGGRPTGERIFFHCQKYLQIMGKLEIEFLLLFLRVLTILLEKPKGDDLRTIKIESWLGFPADDWCDWFFTRKA